MIAILNAQPSWRHLLLLFGVSFLVRSATFYFYIQHEERYHQADSMDYHNSALAIALGAGMTKLQNNQPIFWRVPGYPWFLSHFYNWYGVRSGVFKDNAAAQKAALWLQIFLCSCIPIILFYLALTLTGLLSLAWILAWISVIHLGLVLSSTFFLTEGLTLIFFYVFLIFFYKSFRCIGEQANNNNHWIKNIILAALFLAIATWIRPMGEFVAVVSSLLILFFSQDSWLLKIKKISLFLLLFFTLIFPWYIRNFNLTGKAFFCPMFGTYLNAFVAPKIVRETSGLPLESTWKQLQNIAHKKAIEAFPFAQAQGKALVLEHVCGSVAWPIVLAHPFLALKVWMPEVFKTTFDLYSSQLVSFANNSFMWDPLEEFLGEKIALALYKQPMPTWMRLICWGEFLFSIFIWISLVIGMIFFWVIPILKKLHISPYTKEMAGLWLKCACMIGAIVFMTGGFGYARLRLPVEPLLIILALSVWFKHSSRENSQK